MTPPPGITARARLFAGRDALRLLNRNGFAPHDLAPCRSVRTGADAAAVTEVPLPQPSEPRRIPHLSKSNGLAAALAYLC